MLLAKDYGTVASTAQIEGTDVPIQRRKIVKLSEVNIREFIPCIMYNEAGETHRCETFEEVYVFEGDGWFHGDKDQKYPRFEDDTDNGDNTEEVTEDKPDREPELLWWKNNVRRFPGSRGKRPGLCERYVRTTGDGYSPG